MNFLDRVGRKRNRSFEASLDPASVRLVVRANGGERRGLSMEFVDKITGAWVIVGIDHDDREKLIARLAELEQELP